MSRQLGFYRFAGNIEGTVEAPADARQLVQYYSDLTGSTTWYDSQTGRNWLYNGAIVAVGSDPITSNNGIYWLCDAANYSGITSWVKVGSGEGAGTLTGATNGLSTILSGTTVVLGGTLSQTTTINGSGQTLCLGTNANPLYNYFTNSCNQTCLDVDNGALCNSGLFLAPNESQLYSNRNGLESYVDVRDVVEIKSNSGSTNTCISLTYSSLCISSTAPSFAGVTYEIDNSVNYQCLSIPHVGWVTGYTQSAVTQTSNTMAVCNISVVSYTATTANDFIGSSGTCYIYLPAIPKPCQRITVADIAGTALGDNVTIIGCWGLNGLPINGYTCACAIINTDYGSISFINNGYFWSAIAFIN